MPNLMTIREVAPILRSSEITIRRLVKTKKIPYRKIGARYLFDENDIKNFIEGVKVAPQQQGGDK